MDLHRRPSGFAFAALVSLTLCLSCTLEETPVTGTGGAPPDGSGGSGGSGVAGAPVTAGAPGSAGAPGTGGVIGNAGAPGSAGTPGTAGGSSGGSAGSGNGGSGNAAGAGATGGSAGNGGTGGSSGAAGSGVAGAGTAGAAGSAGGDAAPSAGCGMPAGLVSGRASIDVNGKMREYILEVPADYDPTQPYRVVFGWHPWGGSAQQIAGQGYFGLENVVDGQAILVAPEGQEYQDNGLGWGNVDGEDIDFLHAMVNLFGSELCIDQNRMFSTGFSFGAMFSFTLACTEMSMMRAIAPMAGNANTSGRCEAGTRSVATLAFIGVDDTLLDGHRDAVQIFVERNGCTTDTLPVTPSWCDGLAAQYEPCSCVEYQGCSAGFPVIECEYQAAHIFAPSAGQTLWDFFSQF